MKCTEDEFVRIWQTAESMAEIVAETGLERGPAMSKAAYFRKQGIPLRDMRAFIRRNMREEDRNRLAKLAEDCLKNGDAK